MVNDCQYSESRRDLVFLRAHCRAKTPRNFLGKLPELAHAWLRACCFGTTQQLPTLETPLISHRFPHFTFLSPVRDFGVILHSSFTFSSHISNLTRFFYFHLRRLRATRKPVSIPVVTSLVHAFVCSAIDHCNSLLIGLPKFRLSTLQTVLNASAQLIARLLRFSHISSFMTQQLHWLPFTIRIEFEVLVLVLKSQLGFACS